MKKKGSVTVFFSLFMAVFLILIQVMFHSVQIAGGRVQAQAGVEEGLYSVFAGYQRELLEKYHVFFLDGGYGSGTLQPGYMYQILEESINRSCSPGRTFRDFRGGKSVENFKSIRKNFGVYTCNGSKRSGF